MLRRTIVFALCSMLALPAAGEGPAESSTWFSSFWDGLSDFVLALEATVQPEGVEVPASANAEGDPPVELGPYFIPNG